MGGMVLETNMNEILTRIEEQNKLEKQEVREWPSKLFFSKNFAQICRLLDIWEELIKLIKFTFFLEI